MEISLLSNNYLRQEAASAAYIPAQGMEQAGRDAAEKSLILRNGSSAPFLHRKPAEDSVNISSSPEQGREQQKPYDRNNAGLYYDQSKLHSRDHRLNAWFRTAFAVQGDTPRTSGLNIDIIV